MIDDKPEVSQAGFGQAGFCKVCASPLKNEINKRFRNKHSTASIMRFTQAKNYPITLPTLAKHKAHITDPKTTFVELARKNPVIRDVSHEEFLHTLVALGQKKIEDDPDSVSIDHSLSAAKTLAQKQDKQGAVLILIAQAATGHLPLATIEGEYQEIE